MLPCWWSLLICSHRREYAQKSPSPGYPPAPWTMPANIASLFGHYRQFLAIADAQSPTCQTVGRTDYLLFRAISAAIPQTRLRSTATCLRFLQTHRQRTNVPPAMPTATPSDTTHFPQRQIDFFLGFYDSDCYEILAATLIWYSWSFQAAPFPVYAPNHSFLCNSTYYSKGN